MALREWLITYRIFTQRRKVAKKRWMILTGERRIESMILMLLICATLFATAPFSVAQATRGMTPADTLRMATVGDAQIAPDGSMVCYTVAATEGNATRTALWCAQTGGERVAVAASAPRPQQVLSGEWNVARPRWSPDGRRLAFIATRGEQSGLWVMSPRERQPRFVAPVRSTNFHLPYAGESFVWSPDSRRLAFINASEPANDAGALSAPDDERARRDDPRIIDRIQYKSRTGFSDTLRSHVWLTDVDDPAPRQLTSGQHYDHALAWNPRGDEIAFLSNHEPDPDAVNNSDIFAVSLDGRVRRLTETRGCEYEPAWSPDGKWIAYTATTRDVTTIDSVAEDTHVWVINSAGGRGRELNNSQNLRSRAPRWRADSLEILYTAVVRGSTYIFKVRLDDSAISSVVPRPNVTRATTDEGYFTSEGKFQVGGFSVALQSQARFAMAFTVNTPTRPHEVWATNLSGLSGVLLRRISSHNDAFSHTLSLIEPEEIKFKSFDGTNVQGWLMKPLGFRENERYPLILSIHGGPHGMYGYSFNPAFQVYAARGYAVLFINPRGSSGYGQKFSDGTLGEWGGGDYKDLMAGVDAALRKHTWIDRNRMGVTGGSYGGFMTNWIITQTTRFRAAVASASVSNLVSFYSTSLYQDLIHAEFGGFPWDDYDLLWRWSPLRYVRTVETPTLFIHGELDNDVHITQAEEMYMALRRRGVETVLARYPREGHGFREPRHREDALTRTLAWFDKYLK